LSRRRNGTRGQTGVEEDAVTASALERPFEHIVDLYTRSEDLVSGVAGYLASALIGGGAAIVVATETHRVAFADELWLHGVDVDAARKDSQLIELDAADTLASISPHGSLDGSAFRTVIGGLIDGVGADHRPVHVYGEMVALLWDEGQLSAALDLEVCWNELAHQAQFSLYCSYPQHLVDGEDHAADRAAMCALHSEVRRIPSPSDFSPPEWTSTTRTFEAATSAPAAARQFVRESLGEHADISTLHDAELVVSELVTNVICHAGSRAVVTVSIGRTSTRLEVQDNDRRLPALTTAPHDATGGRGMMIVSALAERWGHHHTPDGKTVWAELRLPS
jgi:anti-sigma regulatory factor (Ser/Thr protein kinase)